MNFSIKTAGRISVFSGLILLAACSKSANNGSNVSNVDVVGTSVSRGPQNQLVIKVTSGKRAAPGSQLNIELDLKLTEEEGYQVAKDRFTQMDMLRRVSQGRLAELVGPKAVERDVEAIAVGLPLAVQRSLDRVSKEQPEVLLGLQYFCRGVNRYLDELANATPVPPLLVQYRTLITRDPNYVPAPWTPADSLSVGTALSFYLSSNIQEKTSLGIIAEIFFATERPEAFFSFLDLRPLYDTFILGDTVPVAGVPRQPDRALRFRESLKPSLLKWLKLGVDDSTYKCKDLGYPFPGCHKPLGIGSNNWVISKNFAGGEETLLANDPHLLLTYPMTFYEVALDSKSAGGNLRVRGFKPPGIPGVLIGMNDDIAWGLTNLGADVDDVYLEEMNAAKTAYFVNGVEKKIDVVPHDHYVRASDGVTILKRTLPIKVTETHGLIFSDYREDLKALIGYLEESGIQGQHLGLSYKWVGHKGTTESVAVWKFNRASNTEEFRSALKHFEVGAQNFIYADRKGNIGYYAHGIFPVRKYVTEEQYPPYMFVMHNPTGLREWEEAPRPIVPEAAKTDGFIVTANNDPYSTSGKPNLNDYKDYFSYSFHDGVRAHRIQELITEKRAASSKLTVDDMKAIQMDHKDMMAMRMIEVLEKVPVTKLSERAKKLRDRLLAWKASGAEASRDSTDVAPFYEWATVYMHDHFKYQSNGKGVSAVKIIDEKLEMTWNAALQSVYITPMAIKTLYHKSQDALAAGAGEVYEAVVARFERTLDAAALLIEQKGIGDVRWGTLNRLSFSDPLGGILPSQFSLGIERPGAWETVDPAAPGLGSAFRMITSVKKDGPMQAIVAVPGSNHDASSKDDRDKISRALVEWRDGTYRDLINH